MMTHANASTNKPGMAGVIALAAGVILSLSAIGAMALSPAAVPAFCATHACPTVPIVAHPSTSSG